MKNTQTYTVQLTKLQIATIKGALEYFGLANDFGYSLITIAPISSTDTSDFDYCRLIRSINTLLDEVNKVNPNYGQWGDIKRVASLFNSKIEIAKAQTKEVEQVIENDSNFEDILIDHINKLGLKGNDILLQVNSDYYKKYGHRYFRRY